MKTTKRLTLHGLSKQYDDLFTMSVEAMVRFRSEVKAGQFPPDATVAQMPADEFERFLDIVN